MSETQSSLDRCLQEFWEAVAFLPFLKFLEDPETKDPFRADASAQYVTRSSLQTVETLPKWRQVPAAYNLHRLFTVGGMLTHDSALHGSKKLGVGLGLLEALEHHFHLFDR